MVQDFLSLLAQALLIIALPILVAAAAYWLRQKALGIKSKVTKDQLATLESIGDLAVRAAEQAGLAKQIGGRAAKKEYAVKGVRVGSFSLEGVALAGSSAVVGNS